MVGTGCFDGILGGLVIDGEGLTCVSLTGSQVVQVLAFDLIDAEHRVHAEDKKTILLVPLIGVDGLGNRGPEANLATPLTLGDMRRSPHYPTVQLTPLVERAVPLRGQLMLLGVK